MLRVIRRSTLVPQFQRGLAATILLSRSAATKPASGITAVGSKPTKKAAPKTAQKQGNNQATKTKPKVPPTVVGLKKTRATRKLSPFFLFVKQNAKAARLSSLPMRKRIKALAKEYKKLPKQQKDDLVQSAAKFQVGKYSTLTATKDLPKSAREFYIRSCKPSRAARRAEIWTTLPKWRVRFHTQRFEILRAGGGKQLRRLGVNPTPKAVDDLHRFVTGPGQQLAEAEATARKQRNPFWKFLGEHLKDAIRANEGDFTSAARQVAAAYNKAKKDLKPGATSVRAKPRGGPKQQPPAEISQGVATVGVRSLKSKAVKDSVIEDVLEPFDRQQLIENVKRCARRPLPELHLVVVGARR